MIRSRPRNRVTLEEAKEKIFNFKSIEHIDPSSFINSLYNQIMLSTGTTSRMDSSIIKLQIICLVGNAFELKSFLNDFLKKEGAIATEFLVNSQMKAGLNISYCNPFYITPLMCTIIWNDEPELVRILYSFGAKLESVDLNFHFPEEKILTIPYFDHISNNGIGRCPFPMWRDLSCFRNIIQEIRRLTNEEVSPIQWRFPEKII